MSLGSWISRLFGRDGKSSPAEIGSSALVDPPRVQQTIVIPRPKPIIQLEFPESILEFEECLNGRLNADIQAWFWAKLTGIRKNGEASFDREIMLCDIERGDAVFLENRHGKAVSVYHVDGPRIGGLKAEQARAILAAQEAGREFEAVVYDSCEVAPGQFEPMIVVIIKNQTWWTKH